MVGVFQEHIVCSILDETSVKPNQVWAIWLIPKLSECVYFVSIVRFGLLGLIGLQDICIRELIVRILLYVSRTSHRFVIYLVHLFGIAIFSQLIVGWVYGDLEGGRTSPTPKSFFVYNRKNLFLPKYFVHVVLKNRRAAFPLFLTERVEEIVAWRSYREIIRHCLEWQSLIAQVIVSDKMCDVAPFANQEEYEEDLGIFFSDLVWLDWGLDSITEQDSEEFFNVVLIAEVTFELLV